jgi:hypothetical protein
MVFADSLVASGRWMVTPAGCQAVVATLDFRPDGSWNELRCHAYADPAQPTGEGSVRVGYGTAPADCLIPRFTAACCDLRGLCFLFGRVIQRCVLRASDHA